LYKEAKGCETRWWLLRFVLDMLILKTKYGWSDRSFNNLLTLLAIVLPKPNSMPANTYQAKKLVSPLTMGVERIHACPNHCVFYRGVFKDLTKCPTYGASRYIVRKTGVQELRTRERWLERKMSLLRTWRKALPYLNSRWY
jgi:hypothetical protein